MCKSCEEITSKVGDGDSVVMRSWAKFQRMQMDTLFKKRDSYDIETKRAVDMAYILIDKLEIMDNIDYEIKKLISSVVGDEEKLDVIVEKIKQNPTICTEVLTLSDKYLKVWEFVRVFDVMSYTTSNVTSKFRDAVIELKSLIGEITGKSYDEE